MYRLFPALLLPALLLAVPAAAQSCLPDEPTAQPLLLTVAQTYPNAEPVLLELQFSEAPGDAVLREFWREDAGEQVWGGQWRYRGLVLQASEQRLGATRSEAVVAEPLARTTRILPREAFDALFPLRPGDVLAATLRETTDAFGEPVTYDTDIEMTVTGADPVDIGGCRFAAVQLTETVVSMRYDFTYDVLYLPNLRIRLNLEVTQAGALAARYAPVALGPAR